MPRAEFPAQQWLPSDETLGAAARGGDRAGEPFPTPMGLSSHLGSPAKLSLLENILRWP